MFGWKKHHMPQKQIDTLIGTSTTLNGNVTFEGGLRVDGQINGNVRSNDGVPSMLVVSSKATVNGDIVVSHVVIDGIVNGPVTASEYLELMPQARINGDVTYKTLEMHVGAIIDGKLIHLEAEARETADIVEMKRISTAGE